MTTTKFLAIVFACLIVMSGIAMIWRPDPQLGGRTPLVWVSDNNPARTAQIGAFNEEHPELFLELDYGSAGAQKIILQCASGVGPDIFDYGSEDIGTYVEAGVVWDVTEAANSMNFSAKKDSWPKGGANTLYQGRQYGFPCNIGSQILIYNKNVFDYFGVPYPTGRMTWEAFVELARKVNSSTSSQTNEGKTIFGCTGANWRIFFETARGEFFDERGLPVIQESEAMKNAFAMHHRLLYQDRVMPSTVESRALSGQGGWGGGLNHFATGRYAMAITGHYALIAFSQAHHQQLKALAARGISPDEITDPLDRPLRLGAVLIPYHEGSEPTYRISSRVAGINAESPRREEALQFLQYLAGPTYSRLLNEGLDWLPGNPEYASLGVEPGPADLARPELQKMTEEAMSFGYVPRDSPFILTSDIVRVLASQISRMESDSEISIDELLESAQREINTLMRRSLDRNPDLKKRFIETFGETIYQAL